MLTERLLSGDRNMFYSRIWAGFVLLSCFGLSLEQDYEVADIDCAIGNGGKELLTARLRRPEGFRGTPIFADDHGLSVGNGVAQLHPESGSDVACRILHDPADSTGRVFVLRVTDFSQCGVLKRNGFIHVRVWFPQLPGVVMLSDQEVIIMCKPPQPIVTQSKAAGFAGSMAGTFLWFISTKKPCRHECKSKNCKSHFTVTLNPRPSGARVSGIVEETPGRLEYEVALFRESGIPSQGRSALAGGSSNFLTGSDAQELPVDQAVPIGTRLQLRARINSDSSWQYAKLMEVSVSPDPKDGSAEGSVALIKKGCRNPDLVSIIPKQPYRIKDKTNEVVLDFEAFLLSNMGERNTLWLHTQIKACMEVQDCNPEFCMDVYQPSGFGRKKRNAHSSHHQFSSVFSTQGRSSADYISPLNQHWRTASGPSWQNKSDIEWATKSRIPFPEHTEEDLRESEEETTSQNATTLFTTTTPAVSTVAPKISTTANTISVKTDAPPSTKFQDNIGFSVIMPAEYYRKSPVETSGFECRGWAASTFAAMAAAILSGILAFILSRKLRNSRAAHKEHDLSYLPSSAHLGREHCKIVGSVKARGGPHHYPISQVKYARDNSVYRS